MILVADASVLVGELLRKRGRDLINHTELHIVVAEHQWSETEHELGRRLTILTDRARVTTERRAEIKNDIRRFVEVGAIEVIGRAAYEHLEGLARRRVPRDPNDWPTVARAVVLDAGILTGDGDFLGCGCPTWTVETLMDELAH